MSLGNRGTGNEQWPSQRRAKDLLSSFNVLAMSSLTYCTPISSRSNRSTHLEIERRVLAVDPARLEQVVQLAVHGQDRTFTTLVVQRDDVRARRRRLEQQVDRRPTIERDLGLGDDEVLLELRIAELDWRGRRRLGRLGRLAVNLDDADARRLAFRLRTAGC